MEKTWRWFGPNDPITLDMLRQIGVEGIVTALHDVPNGDVWEIENISRRKAYIESHGLRWSVVESLPVCEAVKYGGAERDRLIENYKNSLANLVEALNDATHKAENSIPKLKSVTEHSSEDLK